MFLACKTYFPYFICIAIGIHQKYRVGRLSCMEDDRSSALLMALGLVNFLSQCISWGCSLYLFHAVVSAVFLQRNSPTVSFDIGHSNFEQSAYADH